MDLNGKRILLIKQSSLGDVIHTLPVAHALKRCYPASSIGWVVEQGAAPLVAKDPAVDRVHAIHIPSTSDPQSGRLAFAHAFVATLRVWAQLRNTLHAQPYDILLDLHASFRSGLLALANPGGVRIGFRDARELNTLFQHRHVEVPSTTVHAVDKNLLFCSSLGCATQAGDFFLATDAADEQQVDALFDEAGLEPGSPLVYVNPTARWQSKFWLTPRWSELCDRLHTAGVMTVFGGSRADLVTIESITGLMSTRAVVAAGRLGLTASVALMKRATVYAGLDTGPMHMAAMVGTPVVALFGPTHPERVGPYGVKHTVVQAEGVDCLCCRKRVCEQPRCMEGITVDRVFTLVMAYVEPQIAQGVQ